MMRISDYTFEKVSFWFSWLQRKLENLNFRLHNQKTTTSTIFMLKNPQKTQNPTTKKQQKSKKTVS